MVVVPRSASHAWAAEDGAQRGIHVNSLGVLGLLLLSPAATAKSDDADASDTGDADAHADADDDAIDEPPPPPPPPPSQSALLEQHGVLATLASVGVPLA